MIVYTARVTGFSAAEELRSARLNPGVNFSGLRFEAFSVTSE
jgi:hypothetical protein